LLFVLVYLYQKLFAQSAAGTTLCKQELEYIDFCFFLADDHTSYFSFQVTQQYKISQQVDRRLD